ncbi:MAG: 3-deoxy-D-manno-octulosonic acid transferase [Flavobacteriaceae bacterium]|nr:3-deoxy-D-manno-octulosonic acid transferase [Flavobacteriaceae bacterium]
MKLFVNGRKTSMYQITSKLNPSDKVIWMHCASLGEFEQGRPIIDNFKFQFPNYKIVLTFFSPSGYEIRKNYEGADVIVYLPMDTPQKVRKFINVVHPELAIFVKYEFWPNYLKHLRKKNIKTILVSGIFRENQAFFKSNFAWYRNQLKTFSHFFVQDDSSVTLLQNIGFQNVSQSGDTRFDRVSQLVSQKKDIPFLKEFAQEAHVLVAGSTWSPDETILVPYINQTQNLKSKFIIAPHNIHLADIEKLNAGIHKNVVLYSQINIQNAFEAQVLIIDSIGLLSAAYAYAQVAYVGGGFGSGIHNVLEPATYGIPILIGPKYQKFKEAVDLIRLGGCVEIKNEFDLTQTLDLLAQNQNITKTKGQVSKLYVMNNMGASEKILAYIQDVL